MIGIVTIATCFMVGMTVLTYQFILTRESLEALRKEVENGVLREENRASDALREIYVAERKESAGLHTELMAAKLAATTGDVAMLARSTADKLRTQTRIESIAEGNKLMESLNKPIEHVVVSKPLNETPF